MRTRTAIMIGLSVAALGIGCAGDRDQGAPPPADQDQVGEDDTADGAGPGDADPVAGEIDEDEARADAEQLLGVPEDEIEEDAETRIMRRGDEHLAGTMDLRPGRRNLELDDDGTGTYVVTRIVIEVDGEGDLVVE